MSEIVLREKKRRTKTFYDVEHCTVECDFFERDECGWIFLGYGKCRADGGRGVLGGGDIGPYCILKGGYCFPALLERVKSGESLADELREFLDAQRTGTFPELRKALKAYEGRSPGTHGGA